ASRIARGWPSLHRRIALDLGQAWFVYDGLRQAFLRRSIFGLQPSERLLHLSEQLTRLRNDVGVAVAFEFGSKLFVALDPQALVEDVLFSGFDDLLGCFDGIRHGAKDLFTRKVLANRDRVLTAVHRDDRVTVAGNPPLIAWGLIGRVNSGPRSPPR